MSGQQEEPAIPRDVRRTLDLLCAHYGWTLEGEPQPVAHSILNDNYRLDTDAGTFFARIYPKRRDAARIGLEHEAMRFAANAGLPVQPPIADGEGQTQHYLGAYRVAVFPWMEGHTLERGNVSVEQAAAYGDMQGRVQAALAGFRDERLAIGADIAWDTEQSIETLSRIDDLFRYYPSRRPEELEIQRQLRVRLALLESGEARPASDFAGVPHEPCHGDFHERNVLFGADGAIVAVVDWELVSLLPPVFDLYRSLSFVLLDEPAPVDAWVRAYARHIPLARAECEEGIELWWQSVLHNYWALRQVYIEGNRAAREFFPDDAARLERLSSPDYRRALANRVATAAGA